MNKNIQVDLHRLITQSSEHSELTEKKDFTPIAKIGTINKRRTEDVYEHACNITAWQQLYDQLKPGQFKGEIDEFWLDGIQFFREYTNLALRQSCVVWPDALWLGLPVDNSNGYIGSQAISKQSVAIRQGGNEFELSTPNNYTIMGLVVNLEHLQEYIYQLHAEHHSKLPLLMANTTLDINPLKKQRICYFIQQALTIGEQQPETMLNPTVRKVLHNNLLDSVTELLFSAQPTDKAQPRTRINYQKIITKVRDYILDHPQDAITVVDLCQYLNISRRTLQNCFQNVLGISPYTYLKAIRLNAVRRELESNYSQYHTVQDAAMSWGFWHMSQFAADYHALFGELPSSSLAARGRLQNCW